VVFQGRLGSMNVHNLNKDAVLGILTSVYR